MGTLRIALACAGLSACIPPPILRRPEAVTIGESQLLAVDTGSASEERTKREGKNACGEYNTNCVRYDEVTKYDVDVMTASATLDGEPISIDKVASATSEKYRTDLEKYQSLRSSCRNGSIVMDVGIVSALAGVFLLNVGYGSDEPRNEYVASGFAAAGVGVAALLLGKFVVGGQHCKEAKEIWGNWYPVVSEYDETEVRGKSAEYLEQLVTKFNETRSEVTPSEPVEDPPVEDSPVEETPTE
jgi:hypothetical protein